MRGKTSLLNAIRFVFFGEVRTRSSSEMDYTDICNWESQEEGNYDVRVSLSFSVNDDNYLLTRELKPKPDVDVPRNNRDYELDMTLRQNDSLLSAHESKNTLKNIMPENISRFFLFDGELLQEYEELLKDESDTGRRIKESVERILGVPILKNGRAHAQANFERAEREESKKASKKKETQEIAKFIEQKIDEREAFDDDLGSAKDELQEKKSELRRVKQEMEQFERVQGYLEKRKEIKKELSTLEEREEELKEKLQDVMSNGWKISLSGIIEDELDKLEEKENELIGKIFTKPLNSDFVEEKLEENNCPVCEKHLEETETVEENLHKFVMANFDKDDSFNDLPKIKTQIEQFRSIYDAKNSKVIEEWVGELYDIALDRTYYEEELKDIKDKIEGYDEEEFNELDEKLSNLEDAIGHLEKNEIPSLKQEKKERENKIDNLKEELDKQSGVDLKKERERRKFYEDLHDLFDEGITKYRKELLKEVEQDATEIFLKLVDEPEYKELNINESYGLKIIHENGQEISVRSAGAEHIVAISLIGALHNNTPLRGPIFMDSPFGRLDEKHTKNVVRLLPETFRQVVLLVFKDELQPQEARELLAGKLKSEYEFTRISARHTDIEAV